MRQLKRVFVSTLVFLAVAASARAELPAAETLLADVGYSADEIASIMAGKIVTASAKAANERDLVAAFAFYVKLPPAELAKDLKSGLLGDVDPNTIYAGTISATGTLDDFAKLALNPATDARVKKYLAAKGGGDLNLSTDEIAAFNRLGASAATPAVEAQVRSSLLARYQAYHAKGLAGIPAYDRGSGSVRSAADELTTSLKSMTGLQKYAPAAYAAMMGYPSSKPAGTDERFRWMHFNAHDVPTIALVHGMIIPDGDALIALQRQYYVSEGFNCEQAVAGFLPAQGGTVVVYVNHTSTDQVEGFGGGAKRSIGSKLLSSQLQGIFSKLQTQAQ